MDTGNKVMTETEKINKRLAQHGRTAYKKAKSVICLPMHHVLSEENLERILNCIRK